MYVAGVLLAIFSFVKSKALTYLREYLRVAFILVLAFFVKSGALTLWEPTDGKKGER